jgi:hypothetical protein
VDKSKNDLIIGKSQTSYSREINSSITNFGNQENISEFRRQNSI